MKTNTKRKASDHFFALSLLFVLGLGFLSFLMINRTDSIVSDSEIALSENIQQVFGKSVANLALGSYSFAVPEQWGEAEVYKTQDNSQVAEFEKIVIQSKVDPSVSTTHTMTLKISESPFEYSNNDGGILRTDGDGWQIEGFEAEAITAQLSPLVYGVNSVENGGGSVDFFTLRDSYVIHVSDTLDLVSTGTFDQSTVDTDSVPTTADVIKVLNSVRIQE